MRYLLWLAAPTPHDEQASVAAARTGFQRCEAELAQAGVLLAAEAFADARHVLTVCHHHGVVRHVRGPRCDVPIQASACWLIEVKCEEDAVAWAERATRMHRECVSELRKVR